jgi:hypothetical protein
MCIPCLHNAELFLQIFQCIVQFTAIRLNSEFGSLIFMGSIFLLYKTCFTLVFPHRRHPMSTSEILVLIVLIPFTAFNLYYLTFGKKKKQAANQHLRQTFSELENKTIAEMEKNNLKFNEKQAFLNDAGQGVQLSFGKESWQMAITLKDAFHLMPFSDVLACSVQHDELNGKYSNIRAEIKTTDKVITIVFGTKARKPKSIIGKMIIEEATEFCNLVNTHCNLAVSETSRRVETHEGIATPIVSRQT